MPTSASPRATACTMESNVTNTNRGVRPRPRAMRSAISTSNPTNLSGCEGSASTNGAPPSGSPAHLSSCAIARGGATAMAKRQTVASRKSQVTSRLFLRSRQSQLRRRLTTDDSDLRLVTRDLRPSPSLLLPNLLFFSIQLDDVDAVRRLSQKVPAKVIGPDPV